MEKKGNLGIQTIFYILMALFMIAIMVFGFQKIFFIQEQLSEQERVQIQKDINYALQYCEDPLNKGSLKVFEIKNPSINSVCIFSGIQEDIIEKIENLFEESKITDVDNLNLLKDIENEFKSIVEGGHDVIIFKSNFYKTSEDSYTLKNYQLIDSFKADLNNEKLLCAFDLDQTGVLELKISCD